MNCDYTKEWCKRCSVETIVCEENACDICKEDKEDKWERERV